MKHIKLNQDRVESLEKAISNRSPSDDLEDNNNCSPVTIIKMMDQIKNLENFVEKHKENIDSIPIIQKYTYKNEQDILDVRKRVNDTMPPHSSSYSNPIVIPDDNGSPSYPSNNGYPSNKRQKMNDNDYVNKNIYNSGPDDLVPINNDQRTLNASGMFNRSRNNRNVPPPLSINPNPKFSPNSASNMSNQYSSSPPNSTLVLIENRINDITNQLNVNAQSLNTISDQIIDKILQNIFEKFNEISAQMNAMNLKNMKNVTDDMENRLKDHQDKINNYYRNLIDDCVKSTKKIHHDSMDQIAKNISVQVNVWKRKTAEDLQTQFGKTIQELKHQILSLSKLPIPKNSTEYTNLLEFLKDIFRWNWENWKVEWTKEYYQSIKILQKEYIQPLEDKIKRLEKAK
ncbi:hypothetical protein PIROE2DRAFT_63218 [Piromyces sp. E2]|nr:hypothetical protein PIROE2DRAFT_63218 [Piromyces sp. E2]|eukprot:OUM60324.1 hypothetical protein PIROE2DRAFT_63218 [Piromyces sp. E2]